MEYTIFIITVLRAQEELEALVGRVGKLLNHIFQFCNFRTSLTWIYISSTWIFQAKSGEIQKLIYYFDPPNTVSDLGFHLVGFAGFIIVLLLIILLYLLFQLMVYYLDYYNIQKNSQTCDIRL